MLCHAMVEISNSKKKKTWILVIVTAYDVNSRAVSYGMDFPDRGVEPIRPNEKSKRPPKYLLPPRMDGLSVDRPCRNQYRHLPPVNNDVGE